MATTDLRDGKGNFALRRPHVDDEGMRDQLEQLAKPAKEYIVSVCWSKAHWKRDGFHTQICIQGWLQQHDDEEEKFRVLVSKAIYAYFGADEVTAIVCRPDEPFKDGSHAVIYIE